MQGNAPRGRPLVSVVMAVRDPHPVFFPQAVRSALGQTLDDLELIVVERPSGRSAAALLREVRDERVTHLVSGEPTSFVAQLNRGLHAARGRYVARLDADDAAEPRRLEKQVDYLEAHPDVDVLGSQVRVMDGEGNDVGYRSYPLDHAGIVAALRRYNPLCHPATTFAREAVLAAGGYRYARYPAEDYELWCRLARHGARFANHPEALLRYRVHGEQIKTVALRSVLRGTLEVKRLYWGGEMGWGDAARMWGERLLLLAPPPFVLALFKALYYRRRPGARPAPVPGAAAEPGRAPVRL